MRLFIIAIIATIASGCTEEAKAPELQIPANTPSEVAKVVTDGYPKVVNACPGLSEYSVDLTPVSLENYLWLEDEAYRRVEIVFKVSNQPKEIPDEFKAYGHTCQFGIRADGKMLIFTKDVCASVCTGHKISSSSNVEIPL